jgi:rubredoxin
MLVSTTAMPATRECPLCGESMRLKERAHTIYIPGNPEPATEMLREWVCPECDYFEDVEEEGI